jgi:hypothetical protein
LRHLQSPPFWIDSFPAIPAAISAGLPLKKPPYTGVKNLFPTFSSAYPDFPPFPVRAVLTWVVETYLPGTRNPAF